MLTAWHKIGTMVTGSVHLRDYDLTQRATPPDASQATKLRTSGTAARDVFEWPALALTRIDVGAWARMKIEAAEAEAELMKAVGAHPCFMSASRFTVASNPYTGASPGRR